MLIQGWNRGNKFAAVGFALNMTATGFKLASRGGAIALGVVGLVILAVVLSRRSSNISLAPGSTAAPGWELKDTDGKPVKLSEFKGKVVILDFWATWCGPCRMEIPGFVELQKQYGDRGVVVIGISLDEGGPQGVKTFMKQFNINYPIVMGDEKVTRDYGGIEGIPTTFILDRQGRIVARHTGYREKQQFEKEIKRLLDE